jgi:tRNA-dihydrouridine synthase 3
VDNECSFDFIDINMGCPIDVVVNKGAGSSLLNKPMRIKGIVQASSAVTNRPLTVKVISRHNFLGILRSLLMCE